jgi:RNA polymerase sigma-70 factor (ECF subfamily)
MEPRPAPAELSDRELVLAFQQGSRAAYEEIFRRHQQRVHRVCYRILRNPQDADEATQEAFLRSYQALGRFNGQYQLGAWLSRIAANICFDQLRSRTRSIAVVSVPTENDAVEAEGLQPDNLVGQQINLSETLNGMSPLHAKAIVLRAVGGFSHKEMADQLEMSTEQVKSLLHRSRTSFRKAWDKAAGWGVAPLAGFRSLLTSRSKDATEASQGVAAGVCSPMGSLFVERVAASAVAAVMAISGFVTPGTTPGAPTKPAPSVGPRYDSKMAQQRPASRDTGKTNVTRSEAGSPAAAPGPSDLATKVVAETFTLARPITQTIEPKDQPDPPDDPGGPNAGPSDVPGPAGDKLEEALEDASELIPDDGPAAN